MNVGILNITGYAGMELARILHHHPDVTLKAVTGRSDAGKKVGSLLPNLSNLNLTIQSEITESVDILFSALPHKTSAQTCLPFIKSGVKVIDLSADFRLKSEKQYEEWYEKHPCPEYLSEAVYGLTELYRKDIPGSNLIANPGCYPTGAILALAPIIQGDLINSDIVIDSKSGVSGAGRGLSLTTHFSEVNESVSAYGFDGHRHLPEIVQELDKISTKFKSNVTFLPHLIPMTRGIYSTCYVSLKDKSDFSKKNGPQELRSIYEDFYKNDPFVQVSDAPPSTKQTTGSNMCIVYPSMDKISGKLILTSCIDNLIKGAAGQAVENMNLMMSLPETQGIGNLALNP